MNQDIFTLHQFTIPIETLSEPIYLIPFGDVHRHTKLCDVEKWHEFLEWAKSKQRIYFLGMGDYDDLLSTSERNVLKSAQFHETTINTLEEIYDKYIGELFEEISFMKGKVVGLLEGNHYATFEDGTSSTQQLCHRLKCKYLGVSSFIQLVFNYRDVQSCILDIWCHHGKGAARLVGGSLNSVQQMGEQAQADIYLMGHDHKKSVGMTSKLCLKSGGTGLRLHNRKQLYIRTGSFLRGYVDNYPSYIAKKGLNPTDLGVVKIELTPRKRQENNSNLEIDLHASI